MWTPRDIIAAIIAGTILTFGLTGIIVVGVYKVPLGETFKEIMLVLTGGLVLWLGGGKSS